MKLFCSCRWDAFSLLLLSRFFFYVFSFQNFDYDVSWCRVLGLSCLEFAQILDFVGLWILPNLRNFHHYFYEYFLSPTSFLLVFLGLWSHKCYIILCSLVGHWVSLPFWVVFLFLFFPSLFSLFHSDFVISSVLSSS